MAAQAKHKKTCEAYSGNASKMCMHVTACVMCRCWQSLSISKTALIYPAVMGTGEQIKDWI